MAVKVVGFIELPSKSNKCITEEGFVDSINEEDKYRDLLSELSYCEMMMDRNEGTVYFDRYALRMIDIENRIENLNS